MFQEKRLNKEFFGHKYMVVNPFEKLLQLNFIPTSSVIARKSCFNGHIFFNEERRYAEDWELWLRMSLYMIEVIESFIKKQDGGECLKNKCYAIYLKNTYKWAGYHFMLKGNTKLAREFYRKSMKESFDANYYYYENK